jgi:hypothetical protein
LRRLVGAPLIQSVSRLREQGLKRHKALEQVREKRNDRQLRPVAGHKDIGRGLFEGRAKVTITRQLLIVAVFSCGKVLKEDLPKRLVSGLTQLDRLLAFFQAPVNPWPIILSGTIVLSNSAASTLPDASAASLSVVPSASAFSAM